MKKLLLIIVVVALAYGYVQESGIPIHSLPILSGGSESTLQTAYRNRESNLQVKGEGTVIRILPDDLEGSRHQKFMLKTTSGQTLLVAHNIDLAPKINEIKNGDLIQFHGEYEWNSKGGVIHWTHHDPNNMHTDGWLKHEGRTYQ
jgi:molybdopterin converting factor small subunit